MSRLQAHGTGTRRSWSRSPQVYVVPFAPGLLIRSFPGSARPARIAPHVLTDEIICRFRSVPHRATHHSASTSESLAELESVAGRYVRYAVPGGRPRHEG